MYIYIYIYLHTTSYPHIVIGHLPHIFLHVHRVRLASDFRSSQECCSLDPENKHSSGLNPDTPNALTKVAWRLGIFLTNRVAYFSGEGAAVSFCWFYVFFEESWFQGSQKETSDFRAPHLHTSAEGSAVQWIRPVLFCWVGAPHMGKPHKGSVCPTDWGNSMCGGTPFRRLAPAMG